MHRKCSAGGCHRTCRPNRFGWSFFFAVWRRCARSRLHMNSVVLVQSQGSSALVRIVRLQKFDRRGTTCSSHVHLNRLIDENTPLEQSTIETCLQEAYKYKKVAKISCDSCMIARWHQCGTMTSQMLARASFSAVCWPSSRSNFDLRPSPSNSTEKNLSYQSLWFWSAVFL